MEGDYSFIFPTLHFFHFNPLPPHGGRPQCRIKAIDTLNISIHSLRMEGDSVRIAYCLQTIISIHSLRMEGDGQNNKYMTQNKHFNPLPPHGGRRLYKRAGKRRRCISIHSLRMEGDKRNYIWYKQFRLFQSTPSAWRETAKLHRKAFFISPILVQSCKKGCKRLHSAPEKMVFFEKREKNLVRNLQHLSVRL